MKHANPDKTPTIQQAEEYNAIDRLFAAREALTNCVPGNKADARWRNYEQCVHNLFMAMRANGREIVYT